MAYSNGEIDALVMSASGDKSKYQGVLDYVIANYDSTEMKAHVQSRLPLLNSAMGDKDLAGLAQKYLDAKNLGTSSEGFTKALSTDADVKKFNLIIPTPQAETPPPPAAEQPAPQAEQPAPSAEQPAPPAEEPAPAAEQPAPAPEQSVPVIDRDTALGNALAEAQKSENGVAVSEAATKYQDAIGNAAKGNGGGEPEAAAEAYRNLGNAIRSSGVNYQDDAELADAKSNVYNDPEAAYNAKAGMDKSLEIAAAGNKQSEATIAQTEASGTETSSDTASSDTASSETAAEVSKTVSNIPEGNIDPETGQVLPDEAFEKPAAEVAEQPASEAASEVTVAKAIPVNEVEIGLRGLAEQDVAIKQGYSNSNSGPQAEQTRALQEGLESAGYIKSEGVASYKVSKEGVKIDENGAVLIAKEDFGYNQKPRNGKDGLTETAVKNFQRDNGLPETGVADKQTTAALSVYASEQYKDLPVEKKQEIAKSVVADIDAGTPANDAITSASTKYQQEQAEAPAPETVVTKEAEKPVEAAPTVEPVQTAAEAAKTTEPAEPTVETAMGKLNDGQIRMIESELGLPENGIVSENSSQLASLSQKSIEKFAQTFVEKGGDPINDGLASEPFQAGLTEARKVAIEDTKAHGFSAEYEKGILNNIAQAEKASSEITRLPAANTEVAQAETTQTETAAPEAPVEPASLETAAAEPIRSNIPEGNIDPETGQVLPDEAFAEREQTAEEFRAEGDTADKEAAEFRAEGDTTDKEAAEFRAEGDNIDKEAQEFEAVEQGAEVENPGEKEVGERGSVEKPEEGFKAQGDTTNKEADKFEAAEKEKPKAKGGLKEDKSDKGKVEANPNNVNKEPEAKTISLNEKIEAAKLANQDKPAVLDASNLQKALQELGAKNNGQQSGVAASQVNGLDPNRPRDTGVAV